MTRAAVIVVTGAAGFLGSRVVPLVHRRAPRARVIAIVRRRAAGRSSAGVELVAGDLRARDVWERLPRTVTHVIHLAAAIPWSRPLDAHDVVRDNLAPIAHLMNVSKKWTALRRVVYGSSVSVYGRSRARLRESSPVRPDAPYGAAKLAGEMLLGVLRRRGVAVASLRFSSLYGTGQYQGTVLPLLADRARRGLALDVFNGERVQDFLHVDDAASATWLACRGRANGVFNVGTGRSTSMSALARVVRRTFDPDGLSRIVERRGASDDAGVRVSIARARRMLGFRPSVRLIDGLERLASEGLV